MEIRGIFVATITIYCGLYYLTTTLSEEMALIFFILMAFSNAYFLIYWLVHLFRASLIIVIQSVPAFRRKYINPNEFDFEDIIEKPFNKGYYLDDDETRYTLVMNEGNK